MQKQIKDILIVGVGGQGTLLTSRILAQVAVQMGQDVKVSEVHGMAQRGGSVVTQVRYGEKVYSPIIKKGDADIILAFEKIEAARWLGFLKPDGKVIINDDRVDPLPVMSGKAKYPINITDKISQLVPDTQIVDATSLAIECGNIKSANVVLVGMLSDAIGLPPEEVEKAIKKMVPEKALDVNLKAFEEGRKLLSNAS
ncbi:Indolepyruvate oxidoreductase subunit IorB [Candidatus Syntrophocurvum alkaliphilum]|uniref:Indolepyruvate oxidoreductase subunit IorB n=1 Tax=Candidatus Syntrophocurvum alkaliphilum TaxID=2293317 RepID=A0A6I6DGN2_9FIRM|nr:indolepyruvate oxidoreductase subunit beta [Candidatus Syntrophocurvum alkaliphilum]QGT99550.1 Indolepyruvate oxidoreductase subunit IorB [Candidatus Syntrophocurvum alkaliphilum]